MRPAAARILHLSGITLAISETMRAAALRACKIANAPSASAHSTSIGMPYNHDYYDRLLKASGFKKKTNYFSGYLPGSHELPRRFFDIAERVKKNSAVQW